MSSNKYILIILAIVLTWTAQFVQAAKIAVQGPTRVAAGEQFQIRYVVNGTSDVKNFRMGNVPDAIEVLYGPSTSTQQSFSIINGKTSSQSSVTYTYVLMAQKTGTFVIPSAHANVDGNAAVSSALKINVSGKPQAQANATQGAQQQSSARVGQRIDRAGARISGNDLFIKVTANKHRVTEQEPVLLTYKVYTQVELTQLEGKMPDLNGFHTQEIPLPQQKTFHIETVNGKAYRCVTWSQYVMYPQMSGKLEIPSLTFRGIVMQQDPTVDPLEAFFNGGSGYIEVKKEIKAPSVQIQVDPLPARPTGFLGGVGHFNVQASLDKNTVKAGDPVNLRIVVSGTGNLKLLKEPLVEVPSDFDKYDAKVTDKSKLQATGLAGSMVYDILIVPRNKGQYTIPGIKYIYFDTDTKAYKTIETQPMPLTVTPGTGTGGGVTDYAQRNDNDIRDIMTDRSVRENPADAVFGTTAYVLVNLLIVAVFVALLIVFRKRAVMLADVTAMKGKKANKVAIKRLKKAAKLLAAKKQNEFYDEVLRALWGYVSDKFAMPVEQLMRDNITGKLSSRDVDPNVTTSFIQALDECEYARFAPGDSDGNMQKTYDKAADAIMQIENHVKTTKKSRNAKAHMATALIVATAMTALAQGAYAQQNVAANADAAYRSGDYQKALSLYQHDLLQGETAATYNNMGNAYFRTGNIPMAVYSYEKAHILEPMNADVEHNIEIARKKTADRLQPETEIIFAKWYKAAVMTHSIDTWCYTSTISLVVALLLFLVYLFAGKMAVKRIAFYASMLLVAIFFVANVCAWQRKSILEAHDTAVAMQREIHVKSSPTAKSPDACLIHEGTKVRITDKEMKGWYAIRLADGREGWLQASSVKLL